MKQFMERAKVIFSYNLVIFLSILVLLWSDVIDMKKTSAQEFHQPMNAALLGQVVSKKFRRVINAEQVVTLLDAERAISKLEDSSRIIILDARDFAPHYYWSHLKDALHSPWRLFTKGRKSGELLDKERLQAKVQSLGISEQKMVLIYGDWSQGWGEEARMLWLLEYLGHDRVYVVEGGWQALKKSNMKTTWGNSPQVKHSTWQVQIKEQVRANTDKVRQLLKEKRVSIDARSQKEYEGATPYGSDYGGHFKKSVHLPWKKLLDSSNKLYPPHKLKDIFSALGLNPDEPVFTYCTGGIRSAFIYLALREAGYKKAMNYDGSWWAWTSTYPSSSLSDYQ